jgi:hypothetical protein
MYRSTPLNFRWTIPLNATNGGEINDAKKIRRFISLFILLNDDTAVSLTTMSQNSASSAQLSGLAQLWQQLQLSVNNIAESQYTVRNILEFI